MEIELNNINYGNKLVNINYKFEINKVTSIIGNSGSGKSLIGYVIMDLIIDYQGSVLVDGKRDYDTYKLMKDVGYVFQNPRDHFFCDTVYEEIGFGLKQFKFKLNKMDIQIRNALKMVGLDDKYLGYKVNNLSSGEMERVAIASSLVLNPKILILDEPTIYLDNKAKDELIKLINVLINKYNKTIIVMSNDMEFVYRISDNYVLMSNGRIVRVGSIDDLIEDNDILENYEMEVPLIKSFVDIANKRNEVRLDYVRDINDLVREVINNGK